MGLTEDGFGCWEVAQPRRAWELGQGSVDALGTPCRWPPVGAAFWAEPLTCGVCTGPWGSWCQSGLLDTQLVLRNREVALDLPSSGSHVKDKGRVREGVLSTGKGPVQPPSPVLHIKDRGEQSAESAPAFFPWDTPFSGSEGTGACRL